MNFYSRNDSSSNITDIKDLLYNVTSSAVISIKNITDFMIDVENDDKNSVLIKTSTFSLQLQDNSLKTNNEARDNKLPIIDYSKCEEKLKESGQIPQNENVFAKNIIFDPNLINNSNFELTVTVSK